MFDMNEQLQDEIKNKFFNDPDFLIEVLASYENTLNICITQMLDAIRINDGSLLSKMSHKLKGSTLNFVNSPTTQLLSEIEKTNGEGLPISINSELVQKLNADLKAMILSLKEFSKDW